MGFKMFREFSPDAQIFVEPFSIHFNNRIARKKHSSLTGGMVNG
jgi:hypothetical protein